MDKQKATESLELALQALRDLEEAIHDGNGPAIGLKIEVLRGTLFSVLEMMQLEKDG